MLFVFLFYFGVIVQNSGTNTIINENITQVISNGAIENSNAQVDNEVSQINENNTNDEKPLDMSANSNAQVCSFDCFILDCILLFLMIILFKLNYIIYDKKFYVA